MIEHTREDIERRYARGDVPFTIGLEYGGRAWDPETGDTLLGPLTVVYDCGQFPGPARTATVLR